jgi:hypothetical protein
MGPPPAANLRKKTPGPGFQILGLKPELGPNPGAWREHRRNPAHLSVLRAQNLAGLRVHQMRLGARQTRHLDVSRFIIIGVISRPSLNVVASVGAAVQERRHDLAFLFFWLWYSERWDGAPMVFRERPTVSRQDIAFDYSSPAELYLSRRRGRHTDYRRFATAAEAIHYAVVELRTRLSLSAWMQVGERFNEDEINRLYDDDDYPLRTPLSSARGSATE